jgi:beta-glucosidase
VLIISRVTNTKDMRLHRLLGLVFSIEIAAALLWAAQRPEPNTSPEQRASELVAHMTLEEKVSQMQNKAPGIPRLGIPPYDWWNEALHGVARAGLATVFPQAIGLAATWDTDLESRIASAISTEARAKYNDAIRQGNHGRYYGLTFWSPNINIFRDPRWGRGQETYGEDPFLTASMGLAFVKAMQGSDPHYFQTIATSKHFAVHSGPESTRHQFDARPTEEDLNNTYLYAFKATLEPGGADSVMCSYNRVDGAPACASDMLLKQRLREDWKFRGYVVSDCDAIQDIYKGHQYAASAAQASAKAVKAGTDLDCGSTYKSLVDAVHQGLISEKEIDRSVERLFTARFRLGMFDPPDKVPFSRIGMDEVESAAHQKLALEAAEKSMVLLKNEKQLLPLGGSIKRLAVVGPAADDPDALLANYNGMPSHIVTPLAGIEKRFGGGAVVRFALGSTYVESASALVPSNVLEPDPSAAGQHGLRAEYFANSDFSGTAAVRRVEPRLYFQWEMQDAAMQRAIPREHFSVRWQGFLRVPHSGEYRLGLLRAECHSCPRTDAARLYLDDKLLVDLQTRAGESVTPETATVHLEAGRATSIRIEYRQTGGAGGVELLWKPPAEASLADAVEAVKQSDAAILCVGLNAHLEGEESKIHIPGFSGGDRTNINLPEPQEDLLDKVLGLGKPTVVVLVNGSALAVRSAKERAGAIVEAWYPGQEGGTAIADTLAGDSDPGGRLPVTFYQSADQLPAFDDYSMKGRTYRYFTGEPLYPFGYGLSFASFRYSSLSLKPRARGLEISAMVANTSHREGDEVVQLYLTRAEGAEPTLRGFRRIHLRGGEGRQVTFALDGGELRGWDSVSIGGGQPNRSFNPNGYVERRLPRTDER